METKQKDLFGIINKIILMPEYIKVSKTLSITPALYEAVMEKTKKIGASFSHYICRLIERDLGVISVVTKSIKLQPFNYSPEKQK